jgi:hypothetical protein
LNELQQTYKEPVSVWLIQPFKRDTKWQNNDDES